MSKQSPPTTDLSALSGLAPELAEMLVAVACDIALVLDESGIIRNVALGGGEPVTATAEGWLGRRWTDTVTEDTRRKAEEFLADIARGGASRPRHLNHESRSGVDIPISYTAVRLGERGPTLAIGRDLRVVSSMQQRLLQAQADMEREHWQRRQAEPRYRLLFHIAIEPTLIIDATSYAMIDVNRAAGSLFGRAAETLVASPFLAEIETTDQADAQKLLDTARGSGRVAEGQVQLSQGRGPVRLTVTPFQSDAALVLLLRMRPTGEAAKESAPQVQQAYAELVQRSPDAIVITRDDGTLEQANAAFRRLLELPDGQRLTALRLTDWIATVEGGLAAVLATVKSVGFVQPLRASLLRPQGGAQDIELSATLIDDQDRIGFIIRVPPRPETGTGGAGTESAVH
jgi:transcriptional regulator PpsR